MLFGFLRLYFTVVKQETDPYSGLVRTFVFCFSLETNLKGIGH